MRQPLGRWKSVRKRPRIEQFSRKFQYMTGYSAVNLLNCAKPRLATERCEDYYLSQYLKVLKQSWINKAVR